MIRALLYLRLTSFGNWTATRLRRLREPKYLIGAAAGIAYIWFFFLRHLFAPAKRADFGSLANGALFPPELQPLLLSLAALFFALALLLLGWVLPTEKPGLAFSEAELAFLFPAPVTRRMLIHYKLVSAQFGILFTSLFFTLLSNRWSSLGGNPLTHALGWWVIFSTLNLHLMGAGFTLSRLVDRGVNPPRRRRWVLAGMVLLAAGSVALVWRDLRAPRIEDLHDLPSIGAYLQPLLEEGAIPWALLPFKAVVAPFLAADGQAFLVALAPALFVMAAHYVWVLRVETAFEEASLDLAQKRAARVDAVRQGHSPFAGAPARARREPFRLRARGRPEMAFLWKNLLSTRPYLRARNAAIATAIVIVGGGWLAGQPEQEALSTVIGVIGAVAAMYIAVLGPLFARQDLRSDLPHADILKTYPIRGWQLVLGELLTPLAILTVLIWLGLLTWGIAFRPPGLAWLTPEVRVALVLCLAAVTPGVCALQLMVPNGATIVFPAWAEATRGRQAGIEAFGQRMIFVFLQLVMTVLALLPAFGLGVLAGFAAGWIVPVEVAMVLGTLAALAVLAGEVTLGLSWLGRRFERFDLSLDVPR